MESFNFTGKIFTTENRAGSVTKVDFKKLQTDLLEEIIHVEFDEYDKEKSGRISEEDFCKFLLKKSKVPPAQKARMLKRVKQIWPSKARGVSFASFALLPMPSIRPPEGFAGIGGPSCTDYLLTDEKKRSIYGNQVCCYFYLEY